MFQSLTGRLKTKVCFRPVHPEAVFQSLTGRLKTVCVPGWAARTVVFQSLTGRLKTRPPRLIVAELKRGFNPSQVG